MSVSMFARLAHRHNPTSRSQRRVFLQQSLALGAGLLLSNLPSAWGKSRAASGGKRVVVVGGGLAGLSCAYELKLSGHDVTVIEATSRVGGRVLSFNAANQNEFVAGRNVEGGGELIGSNHPLWVAYAEKFGLKFLDVHESEMDYPIVLDGKIIKGEESLKIYEEIDATLALMNDDARAINEDAPWQSPNAAGLDQRSIADWLKATEAREIVRKALDAQLSGDNGVPDERASYLGMLTAVKGGGIERYWTESEVYRCQGGNQQLAQRFAKELGDRVVTRLPVRTIDIKVDKCIVTCSDGRTLECDQVVLATAPTVWPRIEVKPSFPAKLVAGSQPGNVQLGINTKYFSSVKRRFWQDANLDPISLAGGMDFSWTWDGTDGQDAGKDAPNEAKKDDAPAEGEDAPNNPNPPEHPACLTAFAGGPAAERARARTTADRNAAYAEQLEKVYPGYKEHLEKTTFMDWPGMPFVGAGYSFPAPGQVTSTGPMLAKPHHSGRLHLAGEACCYKFVGYMEGALQSGVAVARRIAK